MSNETAAASPETAPAAEEGSPEAAAALRAELGRVSVERDSLASQLKEARVKEQLLLNRVAELQAKYEPNAVRSPGFQRAFGSSGSDSSFGSGAGELAHIERTFTKDGSLGLKLNEVPESGRALVVTVNKGSQGEQHEQAVGMLVKAVAGTDVTGLGYKELLGLLKSKAKERPLALLFEPPAQSPPESGGIVERTFTKDGSLGLKLNEVPESGRALVVTVNKGSQGEQHEQAVGMLVKAVAGTDVTGLGYKELLGLLKSKAKERPLALLFEPPAQQLAQRGEVVGSGGADSPAGGSRPRSMAKPVRSTSAEQELKRKQRQYSLSHPGFAPAAGTSAAAAAAASTVSEPAALAAEAKTTATRRGQRQFSLTHPDFAAAAAAMQVTEED